MREIKFRCWDVLDKRMLTENDADTLQQTCPSLLAIGLHGLPICIDSTSFKDDEIIGWNRDHNLICMQYTGLKDKNGVEIYEGDIILLNHMGIHGTYTTHEEVRFQDGVFEVDGHNLLRGCHSICEVIGNVYEHAHLLAADA